MRPTGSADRGGICLLEHDPRAMRYLRDVLPGEWNRAATQAAALTARVRYLPWTDRASCFDEFFWTEARRRLATDAITAIVNRQLGRLATQERIEAYGRFCSAVTAATLLQLAEPVRVAEAAAALIHLFSLEAAHREAAWDWLGERDHPGLATSLAGRPGCAFLLLILSPSDSAESFLARDAFWAAMLGRG